MAIAEKKKLFEGRTYYPVTYFAEQFTVSRNTAAGKLKARVIEGDVIYDAAGVSYYEEAAGREAMGASNDRPETDNESALKARKTLAEIRKIEASADLLEGKTLPIADVNHIAMESFRALYQYFVNVLPYRVAEPLAKAKTRGEVIKVLVAEIKAGMEELRDNENLVFGGIQHTFTNADVIQGDIQTGDTGGGN